MKAPGEILKEIRHKYNISQRQCSSNDIDRSLISHIENGKFSMSEDVAKIIANNINNTLKQRGVDRQIDYLQFYEEKYEVLLKATEKLNKLNEFMEKNNIKQFDTEMAKLEEIIDEYYLPEIKLRLLEIATLMAKKQRDFFKAYMYALRALDIAIFIKDESVQIKLYKNITFFLSNMEKYEEVIKVTTFVLKRYKNNYDNNIFLYNCGICLKDMGRYDDAIEYLNAINISPDLINKSQLADIKLSLAICFKNIGKNDISLKILYEILEMFKDEYSYHVADCYNLIINNYKILDNLDMVKRYIEKLINYVNIDDDNYVYPRLLMELGESLEYLEENNQALKYYLLSIKSSINQKRYKIISEVVSHIFNLIKNNNMDHCNEQVFNMLPLVINTELNDNNIMIFLSMMKSFDGSDAIKFYINDLSKIISERN